MADLPSNPTLHRVVLVDDHPVVLEGLQQLISTAPQLEVIAAVRTAADAIQLVRDERPDLVLLDLRLPDNAGPATCRLIKEASPATRVLVFTAFNDRAALRACLDEGADGILLKDQGDIISAVRAVLRGERVLDARLDLRDAVPSPETSTELSKREREVLVLMAQGLTSRGIADALHLSPNTVRGYAQSILTKLGAKNRIQALTNARERGYLA